MFCPKCHTDLDDDLKFCSRCGTELGKKKKPSYFSKTNTFHSTTINSFSGIKKEKDKNDKKEEIKENIKEKNSHEEQYNYSNKYSNTTEKTKEHNEQYKYSERYSKVVKNKPSNHSEQYDYSNNYSNLNTKTFVSSDKDYIKAYMGNNYEEIIKSKLSIPALFLGPVYLLYRKQIFKASILLVLLLLTSLYLSNEVSYYLFIIMNVVIAINFNKNYYESTVKKIESIKTLNQDKTSNEIINICKEKGGTLPAKTIMKVVILYFIVQTILSIIFKYAVVPNEITNEENNQPILTETIGNLTYNKPIDYEEIEYSTEKYKRYEIKEELCYITFQQDIYSNNYLTPKDYLLKYNSYNSEISNTTINELDWFYTNNKYVTEINNKLYVLELKNYKNNDNCNQRFNEMLYSIKNKEQ